MSLGHASITDPNNHEPKGISTALAGKVYRANGDGLSGQWADTDYTLCDSIPDASMAASNSFLPIPSNIQLLAIWVCVDSNFSADETLTFYTTTGLIPGLSIALTSGGSAAGSIFSVILSTPLSLPVGSFIEALCDGGAASPFKATIVYVVRPAT